MKSCHLVATSSDSVVYSVACTEMSFKELNVDGLYQALEKELGAHIATVIRDEEISVANKLIIYCTVMLTMFTSYLH